VVTGKEISSYKDFIDWRETAISPDALPLLRKEEDPAATTSGRTTDTHRFRSGGASPA
jgi:hypothetical protein